MQAAGRSPARHRSRQAIPGRDRDAVEAPADAADERNREAEGRGAGARPAPGAEHIPHAPASSDSHAVAESG